jgi:hypothetical protein
MIAAALSTALVAAIVALVWRDHRREVREARTRRQAAVDAAVFAVVEQWRRDQNAARIQREVRGAFLAVMQPSETPVFDALAAERFEADALAEIEQMTDGGAA